MTCSLEQFNKTVDEYKNQNPGMTDRQARQDMAQFFAEKQFLGISDKLTTEQGDRLTSLWSKVVGTQTSLSDIENIAHTGSFAALLRKNLSESEIDELGVLLTGTGINLESLTTAEHRNLQEISNLKDRFKELEDTETVEELEKAYKEEERALNLRTENRSQTEVNVFILEEQLSAIDALLTISSKVKTDGATAQVKALEAKLQELLQESAKDAEAVRQFNDKLEALDNLLDQENSKKTKDAAKIATIKDEIKKLKDANKGLKKKFKTFGDRAKQIEKLQKELTDLTDDSEVGRYILKLHQDRDRVASRLVALNVSTIGTALSTSIKNAKETAIQRERLKSVAEAGREARLHMVDPFNNAIPRTLTENLFSKSLVEFYFKEKGADKVPDELTREDVEDIARRWSNNVRRTFNGAFFTADSALLGMSKLDAINAFLKKQLVADPTEFGLAEATLTPSQPIGSQPHNPGTVPDSGKVESHAELNALLEAAWRRLRTTYGFNGFTGTISEDVLKSILGPRFLDISPAMWEEAREVTRLPRNISTLSQKERSAIPIAMMRALGHPDPMSMPEYSQPGFDSDFTKLITIDIESHGNIHSEGDDRIKELYVIQVNYREVLPDGSITIRSEILSNVDDKLQNILDPTIRPIAKKRKPITKEQLTKFFLGIEAKQDEGFKVGTYNGNNYDLPYLSKHVTDPNLLGRISMRSFDLLANITSQIPAGSWKAKTYVKGKKLKEILDNNIGKEKPLTKPAEPDFLNDKFSYSAGAAIDLADGKEITLDKVNGINPMWNAANESGNWDRFDAYSINDINLTMSLFVQLGSQESTRLFINPKVSINVPPPKSNLRLNNSGENNEVSMEDSLQAIGKRFEGVVDVIEQTFYKAGYGYRAEAIEEILKELYIASLSASDKLEDKAKVLGLRKTLKTKAQKEETLEVFTVEQSQAFRKGKEEQNKSYFSKYGFILSLNYQNNESNPSVVEIETPERSELPKGTYRIQDGKELLFKNSTENQEIYVTHVLNAFMGLIKKPTLKYKFLNARKKRVKPREQNEGEDDATYWRDVITTYLQTYLKDSTDAPVQIQDFGNGVLDWKPADEVGIAIAQVMMNQKPGVKLTDISIYNGETLETVELRRIEESMKSGSERPKIFGMPNRDAVNMAQPFQLIDELVAYDGFRLRQRLNWARTTTITKELIEYLTKPQKQEEFDPITTYHREVTLDISPDVTTRSWLTHVPNLQQRKENTYRYLFEIPRLLVSFNHDCEYMGMRVPRRFLSSELPVFFAEDFVHPGAPTAAATLSGALEQLAWFSNFGITGPGAEKILHDIVERGLHHVMERGEAAFEDSNKSDYRYSGKHLILATLAAYRGDDTIFLKLLQACGVKDKNGELITDYSKGLFVKGSELPDPRMVCFDMIAGSFTEDGKTISKGILEDFQDPNSEASNNFRGYDAATTRAATAILTKLRRAATREGGKGRGDVKNFLKGVITPAFFQSGRNGFEQGLKGKNKELKAQDRLTEEEISFLAELMNNGKMVAEGRIVDAAIGFSKENIKELKEIIVTSVKQRVTPANTDILRRKSFLQKQSSEDRVRDLQDLYRASIDKMSTRALPPGMDQAEYKAYLIKKDEKAIKDAAEIWSEMSLEDLDGYDYNEALMRLNIALNGEDSWEENQKLADRNLMLYGLSRIAATPYNMVDEVADIHSQILGFPRNNDDLAAYINRDIYFRVGKEAASGRHHMVKWFGIGPEGPKFAQPRVVDNSKERNILGMWEINEKMLDSEFEHLFYKQILFELAPHIRPPQDLGYDPKQESLPEYFKAVENRSPMELVSSEEAKHLEQAMGDDELITLAGGHTMTVREIKELRERYIGARASSLYMRTTLPDRDTPDRTHPAQTNTNIPGFLALRPYYSNIHMTQLGIYALAEVQARNSINANARVQLIKRAEERKEKAEGDPNAIIDPEFRGFGHYLSPEDLMFIPMSGEDMMGGIALMEDIDPEKLRLAAQLETELTEFALAYGLEDLLEKRDFGRLVVIRRIHDKAFVPAARELKGIKGDDINTNDHLVKLTQARIRFADGVTKTVSITERSLSGKHTTSVIDLLVGKEEGVLTVEDYEILREKYGDSLHYMQLLNYLAKVGKIERLMGLQFGIGAENGVLVFGQASRDRMPGTAHSPNFIHGREVFTIYNKILNTDVAKRTLKEVLEESLESFDGILWEERPGATPYPVLESMDVAISLLKDDTVKRARLINLYRLAWKRTIQNVGELSRDLNAKVQMVPDATGRITLRDKSGDLIREKQQIPNRDKTGVDYIPLTSQGILEGEAFVFTQSVEQSTLWQFTPALLDQMLNLTSNYPLFKELETGLQTHKETRVMRSPIDLMKEESEARRFETWRENSDALSEALIFLRKFNPVTKANEESALKTIKDFRDTASGRRFSEVVNFGAYYSSKGSGFSVDVDGVHSLRIKTIDAPYVIKLLNYSRKAEKMGLLSQQNLLTRFIVNSFNKKGNNGFDVGIDVKVLAMMLQTDADSNLAKETILDYFNVKDAKRRQGILDRVNRIYDDIRSIDNALPFQDNRLLYKALAILEKNPDFDIHDTRDYQDAMAEGEIVESDLKSQAEFREKANTSFKEAVRQVETLAACEDVDPSMAVNPNDPTKYATDNAEDFSAIFPKGIHKSSAENIWNALDDMVREGVISPYVRDMKLMLIGTMAEANPEILSDFALHLDKTGDLMYAEKLDGKYRLGMNITALKGTRDQDILFKFAEELLHIARLKFIKTDSSEWSAITSLYRHKNSRGMIREVLMSMNGGGAYDNIEAEVAYVMDNDFGPDEFFAHLGAFFLLRQVLGSEGAIAALRTKYETINRSLNLWQRAFAGMKSTIRRVLTNFNSMRLNPMYSSLVTKAEMVILPMISLGYQPRTDVGNPNARLNTYQRWAMTRNNSSFDPLRIARLTQLRANLAAATTDADKNSIKQQIDAIDVMTCFGIKESEVQPALDELTFTGTGRAISTELLHEDSRIRKAFLARITQNLLVNMGERSSSGLAAFVRSASLINPRWDNAISATANGLFQFWNASNLTYNSPIAPLAAMAHLLDMSAATVNGSFTPVGHLLHSPSQRIGGFDQQKAMLEPAFQAINNSWAAYVEYYPDPQRQLDLVKRVITRVHTALAGGGMGSIGGSLSTDPREARLERDIVSSLVVGIHMTKELMVEAGFAESMDSLDSFPIRFKDLGSLNDESRTAMFQDVQAFTSERYEAMMTTRRLDTPISAPLLLGMGMLPLRTNPNPQSNVITINAADTAILNHVIAVRTRGGMGVPFTPLAGYNEGRTAMVFALFDEAGRVWMARNGTTNVDDWHNYATNSLTNDSIMNTIWGEITARGREFSFQLRNHNMSLNHREVLRGTTTNIKEAIFRNYEANFRANNQIVVPGSDFLDNNTAKLIGFHPKSTSQNFMMPISNDINLKQLLTNQIFGEIGANSVLAPTNSYIPTSQEFFNSGRPNIDKIMETHLDTVTKSMLRGTGFDALTRIMIRRISGVPGAFVSVDELLNLLQTDTEENSGAMPVKILDPLGQEILNQSAKNTLLSGVRRLKAAVEEIRGLSSVDTTSHGRTPDITNSVMKQLVVLRWGGNINFATSLVEGMQTVFNTITTRNPLNAAIDLVLGLTAIAEQGIPDYINDSVLNYIPDSTGKIFPLRTRSRKGLARNSTFFLSVATSNLLPENLLRGDYSSAMVNRLGRWERFMETMRRANSRSMRTLRVANEAQSNRDLVRMLKDGRLHRLRREARRIGPDHIRTLDDIQSLFKAAGVWMDRESATYLYRSGILNGSALEAMEYTIGKAGTYLGTIEYLNLQRVYRIAASGRKTNLRFTHHDVQQATAAIDRFVREKTQMAMVTRQPLDSPHTDSLADNLLIFYKSYPVLFTAQQLLRRSSISSPLRMFIWLMLNTTLDMLYNVILGLARGSFDLEKIYKMAEKAKYDEKKRKALYQFITQMGLRQPIFSNGSSMGIAAQGIGGVYAGMLPNETYSSVGEAAGLATIADAWKVGEKFFDAKATWSDGVLELYRKFGGVLPAGLGNPLARAAVAWAYNNALGGSSSDQHMHDVRFQLELDEAQDIESHLTRWFIRETLPIEPKQTKAPPRNREKEKKDLRDAFMKSYGKKLEKYLPKKPKETTEMAQVPAPVNPEPIAQVPTKPKTLGREGLEPEKAPEGLV